MKATFKHECLLFKVAEALKLNGRGTNRIAVKIYELKKLISNMIFEVLDEIVTHSAVLKFS